MSEQKNESLTAEFEVNGEQVKLSPSVVANYLVNGNGDVTQQEVMMFISLCKYQHLNPFLNEAYLVKFGKQPASIITSKEAFMKRANSDPHYKGFKAGVVVARGDEMKYLTGALTMPNDQLIGGWADVYRDDRDAPIHVEISFSEFGKGQATWKSMPMNMIRKTALVNALREAFPESLGSMYTEDDKQPHSEATPSQSATEKDEPKTVEGLFEEPLTPEQKEVNPVETTKSNASDAVKSESVESAQSASSETSKVSSSASNSESESKGDVADEKQTGLDLDYSNLK